MATVGTDVVAQSAPPTPAASAPLPPVVVEADKKQPKKKAAAKKSAATAAVVSKPTPVPPAMAISTAESSASPLYADPGPGPNLDAPNTTGSRLGITPLETPASIDVISGETARDRGQRTITEAVTQNAPGFTSVAMPVLGSVYAARGFQGTNSVMQLYDGTRLFPGRGNVTFPFSTWSVERIEVLHGPASVLYGDGAIGGVVNVIPKKPITDGMFNEAEVFFDSNNTRRVSFDSSAAVTRDLAYRVTVSKEASDGWIDDGDSENLGISGSVRAQVSDSFVVSISHDYGEQEPMKYFGTPYKNGVFDPRTRDNNYNVANALTEFRDQWTQLKTEWQATDQLTLRNVAYMLNSRREFRNAEDYMWGGGIFDIILPGLFDPDKIYREGIHIRQKQEQVGNRFDATLRSNLLGIQTESVVGFDVNRGDYRYANSIPALGEVDPFDPVPGLYPDPDLLDPQFDSQLDQRSIFAETRLVLSEQFSVVGGVRWDHSSLSRIDHQDPDNTFDGDFNSVNWRGGAVFTPVRNLAFYGQYSVASDPLNVPLLDYSKNISNLKLTRGRQVEVGVKQSLFNGAFEWSLAAYEIVKTDLLFRDTSTQPNTLQQVGQQSSRGVEAAVGIVLGSGWRVDANGALLRANYDDFKAMNFGGLPPYVLTDYSGNVPILVPERTGNVWVTWDFAPGWSANAGVQYVGESFVNIANTIRQPAYTVTNAGLQWKATEAATLDFRVRNVFDKLYMPYTRSFAADDSFVQGWIAPPRTFEAGLRYKF